MAAPKPDTAKPGSDTAKATTPADNATPGAARGIKAFLPLIISVVLMPVLAYAMTMFVLLPKLQKSVGASASSPNSEHHAEEETPDPHGAPAKDHGAPVKDHGGAKSKDHGSSKMKNSVSFKDKVLVNVAGTMGTRYLVVSLTLASSNPDIKQQVTDNEPQLRDLAHSILSSKTITDLEKPGSKNLIRTELIAVFNAALGGNLIQEIFFTEFAVQ